MGIGQIIRVTCVTVALALTCAMHARADPIDDYVKMQIAKQRIPGLSLAVVKDGQIVKLQSYGLANIELNATATSDTVYKLGSLSKPFIATGIMLLAEEGKLAFSDSIATFLDGTPQGWTAMTVHHVLSHTGGLSREAPGFDPLKVQPDSAVIRSAYGMALEFQPGEKWQYSNLGYFVLAEIITRVSGKPWPQFLEERIFARLGMTATRVTDVTSIVPNRASGYALRNDMYQNAPVIAALRPSGALLSTVMDLLRWDAALGSGRVLPPSALETMWTRARLTSGEAARYGLGWYIDGDGADRMIHHPGSIAGFQADYARFPAYNLSVIVLTNRDIAFPAAIAAGVAALYEPKFVPPRIPVQVNPTVLSQYIGSYSLAQAGVLTVTLQDASLRLSSAVTGAIALLQAESPTSFFADTGDPRRRYVFQRETDGSVTALLVVENEQQVDGGEKLP